MGEELRLFIAIELEDLIKEKLEKIKNILRDCSLEIKWVDKCNLHLTLKFLGEVNVDNIDAIEQKLLALKGEVDKFDIRIKGLGAFPNLDYPKVIWTGIDDGQENLKKLQQLLEDSMLDLGFKAEAHSYLPHITLGRTGRKEKNFTLISKRIKEFPFEIDCKQQVNKISLMKSRLTPKGVVYNSLFEVEF
ncbi:2'-5' RNA ligase [Orenia metallireducens]|uniref:RNA 2',3'-cyclic phosphodiesterase n=1 Tax=Orenia metallireducens TaxID=1413210 RepID=A0A285HV52_9FIRM|nr:RNA 2',3'-cyclic phosphodiesterase [Orenia metallireducens]PRX31020.1 2'-5' RNA ligase [Orenia metallireducens]SNY39602.1 2'-5' RNA ligase [Orenia metallireducens]